MVENQHHHQDQYASQHVLKFPVNSTRAVDLPYSRRWQTPCPSCHHASVPVLSHAVRLLFQRNNSPPPYFLPWDNKQTYRRVDGCMDTGARKRLTVFFSQYLEVLPMILIYHTQRPRMCMFISVALYVLKRKQGSSWLGMFLNFRKRRPRDQNPSRVHPDPIFSIVATAPHAFATKNGQKRLHSERSSPVKRG